MATDPSKWKLNHTMLRVKDPKVSIEFYKFLGLSQINKIENPDAKFDLYFLAYDGPKSASPGRHWTDREGMLELTHNYGTESDPSYKVANGNSDPGRGFGHVCVSVDNIQAACKRIEDAGYSFQKKLTDGRMRHIAFAKDPDGYWVEIIGQRPLEETENVQSTDTSSYRFNHSMIRVKDVEKSLAFYQDVMGMTLLRTSESKGAGFNLYFLGYPGGESFPKEGPNGVNPLAGKEGLLELTWNYGTEKEEGKVYHNGNTDPQGFGHICVSVDNLEVACQEFENKRVNWKKRLTDGRMKNIAFVLDPDDYWVEIIQNEKLKKTANCHPQRRRPASAYAWLKSLSSSSEYEQLPKVPTYTTRNSLEAQYIPDRDHHVWTSAYWSTAFLNPARFSKTALFKTKPTRRASFMADLTPEQKLALIQENLSETMRPDIMEDVILKQRRPLVIYWGTATTGRPHCGYFVPMVKIAHFLRAGCRVKILLADLHAVLDNQKAPMELVDHRVKYYRFVIVSLLKAIGVGIDKLEFVVGSDYQKSPEYTTDIYRAMGIVSEHDAKRAGAEVVKQTDNPKLSGLIYPVLQALDEQHLGVDAQFGGVDQRKIFALATETLPKIGYKERTHLMNPMVPGLAGGKMSASDPDSKIDILDNGTVVKKKLKKAFAAPGNVEDNGIISFVEYVLLPVSSLKSPDGKGVFKISRREGEGETLIYNEIDTLKKHYQEDKLTPQLLKASVTEALIDLLAPIQDEFRANSEWQDTEQKAYPPEPEVKKKKLPKDKGSKYPGGAGNAPVEKMKGLTVNENVKS